MIPLGVLDQSPLRQGATPEQALSETLALARHAEALGFDRFWVAEHHNSTALMGAAPEILGTPEQVCEQLQQVARDTGADELSIITITPEFEQRLRSYELVAAGFGRHGNSGVSAESISKVS